MEEKLRLATWNIRGALSDPARAEATLDELTQLDADIITVPDAWHEDSTQSEPTDRELLFTPADFRRRGFTALQATFRENRPDDNFARYGFMTLINSTVAPHYDEIRLGERPAYHLRLDLGSQALHVTSLYFNDQNEANRMDQVRDLLTYLGYCEGDAAILMGDFNAMHADSPVARMISVKPIRSIFKKVPIMNNTLPRLADMARGSVVQAFEEEGFTDVDPRRKPTMPSKLPLFQLDRIMARSSDTITVEVEPPTLTAKPELSDHLQVVTTATITKK